MSQSPIELSIVLVVGKQRQRGAGSLASILAQDGIEKAEVLLVDACAATEPALPCADHPAVRLIAGPARPSMGKLRAEMARQARAAYVAYIEEHARALPGWLDGLLHAFGEGWDGVGAEMHSPNAEQGISLAIAMMNYLRWRPPAVGGESELLPGHNAAYRREALLSFGDELETLLLSEALLQWKMKERGYRLKIEPSVKIAHINEISASSISKGYYHWNRCFGANRPRVLGWSGLEVGLRVLATPLVPPVRTIKMFNYLRRHRSGDLPLFYRMLPSIFVAHSASAAGMAMGYLFGEGQAAYDLTRYELEEERGSV